MCNGLLTCREDTRSTHSHSVMDINDTCLDYELLERNKRVKNGSYRVKSVPF